MFLKNLTIKQFKHFGINKYSIDSKKTKQSLYRLIYSLWLIELKTFKTSIKTNFGNSFI